MDSTNMTAVSNDYVAANNANPITPNNDKVDIAKVEEAVDILRKYIYQQRQHLAQEEPSKVTEEQVTQIPEIQLAAQPILQNDTLAEESTLAYESIPTVETKPEEPNIETVVPTEPSIVSPAVETSTPEPEVMPLEQSVIPTVAVAESNIPTTSPSENDLTMSELDSLMEPITPTDSVTVEPQLQEVIASNNNLNNIPEATPTLGDNLANTPENAPVDTTYVATSNTASATPDDSPTPVVDIPVIMPDGQTVETTPATDSMVTTPQSFGMM